MSPQRIQLRRTKGWRKPEGVIVVSRPTKWGNNFTITPTRDAAAVVELYRYALETGCDPWFDALRKDLPELRGKDLACWCPLDAPCHADVLLELANPLHIGDRVLVDITSRWYEEATVTAVAPPMATVQLDYMIEPPEGGFMLVVDREISTLERIDGS